MIAWRAQRSMPNIFVWRGASWGASGSIPAHSFILMRRDLCLGYADTLKDQPSNGPGPFAAAELTDVLAKLDEMFDA